MPTPERRSTTPDSEKNETEKKLSDTEDTDDKENTERSTFSVPRVSRHEREKHVYRQGLWTEQEHLLFLKGLRRYGTGRWKEIGTIVTTR